MNIYFFSEHTPDPKMVKDLSGPITEQFKGIISDIYPRGDQISFTETLHLGGQELKCCHFIAAESIVVVEGPILQQDPWLKAEIATLLILHTTQEVGRWGQILCKYCGLLQVHRIEVITSQWTSKNPIRGEKV